MKNLIVGLGLLMAGAACAAVDVSPDGAIKTLEDGLARARQSGEKEIRLAAGVYRLAAPITLGAADAGLRIVGAGRGQTLISGARLLPRLTFTAWGTNGVLVAELPNFGAIDVLFWNGTALDQARFPNKRPSADHHVYDTWSLGDAWRHEKELDALEPSRIARWKHPETGTLHAMHALLWGDMHWRIRGVDEKGGLRLEGGWQNNRPSPPHRVFRYVENIFEELDAPGEWFYDQTAGRLYLMPPPGFDARIACLEAATLDRLLTIAGDSPERPVPGITLSGLTFTGTARRFMANKERMLRSDWTLDREAAVRFHNAKDCTVMACEFHELGGNALLFDGFNAGHQVTRCWLHEIGANGVFFAGRLDAVREPCVDYGARRDLATLDRAPGPKSADYPQDCMVRDCLITRTGRVEKQTAPVAIDIAARITVQDCSLYEVPRAGLNIGDGCFGGHRIEGCDVFETVLETGDHGSYNSWGRDRWWFCDLNLIARKTAEFPELTFADVIEPIVLRGNRWRCDHGWDIDLDDGSSNYIIEENLLLHGGLKLREGYRRTVRNNQIIGNTCHLHCWLPKCGDVIEGNLVAGAYELAVMNHWDGQIDFNLFTDGAAAAEKYRAKGCDAHSVGFKPLYADPAAGDYTVLNLPAGARFHNLSATDYGVKDPQLRQLARRPVFPVPDGTAAPRAAAAEKKPFDWNGLIVREFDGAAEFSAFGVAPDTKGYIVVKPRAAFQTNDLILGELPAVGAQAVTVVRNQKKMQLDLRAANAVRRVHFDEGWQFHKGEIAVRLAVKAGMHGGLTDTGVRVAGGEETVIAYTDRDKAAPYKADDWRAVTLPHDWAVEEPFENSFSLGSQPGANGFKPTGVGFYRKEFAMPEAAKSKRTVLTFDGIFRNSTVWVNGHRMGTHESGYTPSHYDLSEVLRYGNEGSNVVLVRVDATDYEGWWYEGAGIYRHAWLTTTDRLHFARYGTFVTTPQVTDDSAVVRIETELANEWESAKSGEVVSSIVGPDGVSVWTGRAAFDLAALGTGKVRQEARVPRPSLWSPETPHLYRLEQRLEVNRATVDWSTVRFGVRTCAITKNGFVLNGKPYPIKGTCNHQDHAGVGVAVPDKLVRYRLRLLKEMGSNAYRTAHHPPSVELLDLCDEMGLLVLDENRHLSATDSGLADLRELVLRDRNHPCVFAWSLENEENLEGTPMGARILRRLHNTVKTLDPTRQTTAAMNHGWNDGGYAEAVDVVGYNYGQRFGQQYKRDHERYPDRLMLATESTSFVSTRGEYRDDHGKGYLSNFGKGVSWGLQPGEDWKHVVDLPYLSGTFVWTGFDYRGEPTPYYWPCINSHFGIMDTCGFPKDGYYAYKAAWTKETVIHAYPAWDMPDQVGQKVRLGVYSNCDEAELFVNGVSLGRKKLEPFLRQEWETVYEPGRLEAVGYRNGKEVVRETSEATGAAVAVTLTSDVRQIAADGCDVAVVNVALRDERGYIAAHAADLVSFSIAGPGRIIGVGNGDPSSHEPDKATQRRAYHGLLQVLVQTTQESGEITLTADAGSAGRATMKIESVK